MQRLFRLAKISIIKLFRHAPGFRSVSSAAKTAAHKLSPKMARKKPRASVALMKVFPNELEAQGEFEGFTEWLQTFDLYRGKKSAEEFEDDGRIVGKFKVSKYQVDPLDRLTVKNNYKTGVINDPLG